MSCCLNHFYYVWTRCYLPTVTEGAHLLWGGWPFMADRLDFIWEKTLHILHGSVFDKDWGHFLDTENVSSHKNVLLAVSS